MVRFNGKYMETFIGLSQIALGWNRIFGLSETSFVVIDLEHQLFLVANYTIEEYWVNRDAYKYMLQRNKSPCTTMYRSWSLSTPSMARGLYWAWSTYSSGLITTWHHFKTRMRFERRTSQGVSHQCVAEMYWFCSTGCPRRHDSIALRKLHGIVTSFNGNISVKPRKGSSLTNSRSRTYLDFHCESATVTVKPLNKKKPPSWNGSPIFFGEREASFP